ncbi:T9SS type A sorting domain-containing protein [Prolixibacteraceae bacterium JC049]|nr:T9SS type A sorting domain-containing protein [Prolixibacteraceae bacterium JC049]
MYKLLLSLFFVCVLVRLGTAQESLNIAGNDVTKYNTHVVWSIGEPVIWTGINGKHAITQGFCQPGNVLNTNIEKEKLQLALYPKPVVNVLNLKVITNELNGLSLKIYPINGSKAVIQQKIQKQHTQILMGGYPSGNYLFCLFKDNSLLRTIKLLKK